MSQTADERGLDALDDEDWTIVADMAAEYDDELGEDLRALHESFAPADAEVGDG